MGHIFVNWRKKICKYTDGVKTNQFTKKNIISKSIYKIEKIKNKKHGELEICSFLRTTTTTKI